MPKDRADMQGEVAQIMAAAEDVTRTVIGEVVDHLATNPVERSAKWHTDDAVANLQAIRGAINSGEELVWAVVDFYLGQLAPPTTRTITATLDVDDHDALVDVARAFGTTPEGYVSMLATQAARNEKSPRLAEGQRRKAVLILADHRERAEQFIERNAESFLGWGITIENARADGMAIRGHSFDLTIVLDDITHPSLREQVAVCTRLGDNPKVIRASLIDRFDPQAG